MIASQAQRYGMSSLMAIRLVRPLASFASCSNVPQLQRYHSKNTESSRSNIYNHTNRQNTRASSSTAANNQNENQEAIWIASHLHQKNPHVLGSLSICHPSTPFVLGFSAFGDDDDHGTCFNAMMNHHQQESIAHSDDNGTFNYHDYGKTMSLMARNTRRVNKANHGARPCNRLGRRARRRRYGNPKRQ